MKRFFTLLLAIWSLSAVAQVTTEPATLANGYDGTIKVIFDPTQGSGGMKTATKCFAHTGLITVNSDSNTDWKYTKGSGWRSADSPELTKREDGKWELLITPNMLDYYGCPESEKIKKIAFVFHDGPGGSKEGKASGGADIFVSVSGWEGSEPQYNTPEQAKRPNGISNGIYYNEQDPSKVTLCTYAASKTEPAKHVFVVGDFNNWQVSEDYQMKQDGNYFWLELSGLEPGKEYAMQYLVIRADGEKKRISDLYSEKLLHSEDQYEPRKLDPTLMKYPSQGSGYVTVLQPGKKAYQWSEATLNFRRPNKNNLIIYEVWVYDYTTERSIPGLMKRLDYIENLGVNAIELMPLCEFDGNLSWGYNPNHYFAMDKAVGTPEMLKQFVDECHRRGIAVIMDMVFNHASGNNPMNKLYPYGTDLANNPWFNTSAPHDGSVLEDWNHDFAPAQEMFSRSLQYWLNEYKLDGFRMDLSHGFCGANCSNLFANLKRYNEAVKAASKDAYFIQEYWGSNPSQGQLISEGMLCWTGQGLSDAYGQLAMGWINQSNTSDNLSAANKDGYIAYNESHDEERNFYKAKTWGNGDLKTNEQLRLSRVPAIMAFNTLLNGSHMIWQYGELGYDYSINSSLNNPNGTGGRVDTKPRCDSWMTQPNELRMQQYQQVAKMVQLRTRLMPKVFEGNPTAQNLSGSYLRSVQWGSDVFVVANFNPEGSESVTLPAGTWYDYLGGASKAAANYSLKSGEVKVFTGSQVVAPTIPLVYDFTNTKPMGWFDTYTEQRIGSARKVMRDGQLQLITDQGIYDITGRKIQ